MYNIKLRNGTIVNNVRFIKEQTDGTNFDKGKYTFNPMRPFILGNWKISKCMVN